MMLSDPLDPDFHQLRQEFLLYVDQVHVRYQFASDPRDVCAALGIQVIPSTVNLYTAVNSVPMIQFDASQPAARLRFTLWHELCHHLFQTSDDAFQTLLEERHGRHTDLSRDLEEQLCNEGAARFLMPQPVVEAVIQVHGLDPRAALHLADECRASHGAALRRLLDSFDLDTWGMVMKRGGWVLTSHTRTRFGIGAQFDVDLNHPVHATFDGTGLFERRVRMPFRLQSTRTPHRWMRAVASDDRVIAIFADAFPPSARSGQPSLF